MGTFWADLVSADNSKVHTPQVILLVIGILLMLLAIVLIIYHCFYHAKGIDGDTVKLILGLLGGGVLNAGASYFSKTATTIISGEGPIPPPSKPAPKGE